jgi:hypothetical protein
MQHSYVYVKGYRHINNHESDIFVPLNHLDLVGEDSQFEF